MEYLHLLSLPFSSEAPVRSHLKTVYVYLTMSVLSATAGAYLHMVNGLFWNFGLLGALASMGLVMGLHFTPDNGKNRGQRTAMLLGFAFLSGAYACVRRKSSQVKDYILDGIEIITVSR